MIQLDITEHRDNVVDSVCCKNIEMILSNESFSDSYKLQEVYAQIKVSKELKKENRDKFLK